MIEQQPSTCQRIPPLRIHHLMVCAAVAAVQLAFWRSTLPDDVLARISESSAAGVMLFAIDQTLNAAGLTLATFSVYWYLKGYAGLMQPGQWLLFIYFVSLLRWVSLRLFGSMIGRRFLFALIAIGYLLVLVPLLQILVTKWAWSPGTAFAFVTISGGVGTMIFAVWAPLNDYVQGVRRTWTHWVGVGLFIAGQVLRIITGSYFYIVWL